MEEEEVDEVEVDEEAPKVTLTAEEQHTLGGLMMVLPSAKRLHNYGKIHHF